MDGRRDVWCGSPDPNDDRDLGPHEPARAEAIFGRTKVDGAPLSGGDEFTEPDFGAMGRDDVPLIAMDSHAPGPPSRRRVRMLRRGYNYTDGSDGLGRLDAGLFFWPTSETSVLRSCQCSGCWPAATPERVHPAHRFGGVCGSAGRGRGRIHRPGAVRGVSSGSPDAISFLHAIGRTRATGPIWQTTEPSASMTWMSGCGSSMT